MKPLDLTKPLQTRDGRPAKFLHKLQCVCRYPIVCVVGSANEEHVIHYNSSGSAQDHCETSADLINVPVKHVREYWVNLYDNETADIYNGRQGADNSRPCKLKRLACKKITIEFVDNEGLE